MAIAWLLVHAHALAQEQQQHAVTYLLAPFLTRYAVVVLLRCHVHRSWSEYQAPTKCVVKDACPGYSNVVNTAATDYVDTQNCATGYESTRCASCSAGYYQLNSLCYYCGSSVDQSSTIIITVLVGVGVMTVLAVAVSTLSSLKLAQAIQVFTLLQGAATVGVAGAQDSPYFGEQLHEAMTYLNFSPYQFHLLGMPHTAPLLLKVSRLLT